MTPTAPGSSANYYLALNGAPNGPHQAGEILRMLAEGSIQRSTLICRDGGAAWVAVAELESTLRLEAPPATPPPPLPAVPPMPLPVVNGPPPAFGPPEPVTPVPGPYGPSEPVAAAAAAAPPVVSGYGGSGAGQYTPRAAGQAPYQPAPAYAESPSDGTRPFRFATLLGALVLFFLPWLELRCSAVNTIRQSGVETIMSSYSIDPSMQSMMAMSGRGDAAQMEGTQAKDRFSSEVGHAWFAGAALLCVVIALGSALSTSGRQTSGIMALMAAVCLGMQMMSGFPLQEKVDTEMKKLRKAGSMKPEEEMMYSMMGGANMMTTTYTPWLYTELGLLVAGAFLGLSGGSKRRN